MEQEDQSSQEENQFAQNEWQPPPTPEALPETTSTRQTLVGIFFEPGQTFAVLRVRPRFIAAALIIVGAVMAFQLAFIQKLGYDNIIRQQLTNSPQAEQLSQQQRNAAIELYSNPAMKGVVYTSPLFGLALIFFVGALIYWGMSAAFGGQANYLQSLSLLVYSSLPYYVVTMLLNLIVLFIKSADDIDVVGAQRGLAQANLSLLVDPKTTPALASLLSSFDLFTFYAMFLAALGFQKIARLSSASAWTIVIVLWVISGVFKIVGTLLSGLAV
jgi:uncharacterized protein (DUF934 family)